MVFYLIFFLILSLQVNNIDVSSFPHEDAVQMFLNAPEPIVVELKRRSTSGTDSINSSTTSSSKSSCETTSVKHQQQSNAVMANTGVQTDPINYHLSSLEHESQNSDVGYAIQEFLYDESPTSDHQDDECLPPDIDIEVCNR